MNKKSKHIQKPESSKVVQESSTSLYVFLFFSTIFLPVFHLNEAFDITLMPRTMILGGFLLLFGLYFFQKGVDLTPWRHPIMAILLLYLISVVLSNIMSDAYREGLFDVAKSSMFLAMIGIGALLFYKYDQWQRVLPGFVVIAAFIAVAIGAQQYITHVINGSRKFTQDGLPIVYKVVGIMSHKNEYSNALLLLMPFLALGVVQYRKWWRILSIVALLAVLVMIFLVKSRAVWMGVAGAVSFSGLVALIWGQKFGIPSRWRISISMLILFIVSGIAYIMFLAPKTKNEYSNLGRIQSIANLNSQNNIHRLRIWEGTIEMIQDHPILGVGPGNWRMNYHPYVAGVFDEAAQINWAQPHNDFLWVFAEKGILGILSFVGFFLLLIFSGFRIIIKSEDAVYRQIALILLGGVIGYIIISLFAFPYERINHQVYLSMMAGAMVATYAKAFPFKNINLSVSPLRMLVVAIGIWGFVYGYHAVQQEISLRRMFEYMNVKNYQKAIRYANESRNPFRRVDFSSSVADYYISNAYYKDNQLDSAIVYCQKALEVFPENVVYVNQMGKYLFEKKDYTNSIKYFSKAYKVLNKDRKIFTNIAICYYQLGEYEEALRILERAPDHLKNDEIKTRIEILQNLIQEKKNIPVPNN